MDGEAETLVFPLHLCKLWLKLRGSLCISMIFNQLAGFYGADVNKSHYARVKKLHRTIVFLSKWCIFKAPAKLVRNPPSWWLQLSLIPDWLELSSARSVTAQPLTLSCPFAQFREWTEDGVQGTDAAAATFYMRPARPGPDTVNVYRPSGSPGPARHVKQCLFSFAVKTAQSAQLNSLPPNE